MRTCFIKGKKYIADADGQPTVAVVTVAPNVTVTTSNPDTLAELTKATIEKAPQDA